MERMSSEKIFFMYAFPCSHFLLAMEKIDREDFDELKRHFFAGSCPSRSEIERVFPNAFKLIRKFADESGRDYWDEEVIREYWEFGHNDFIDGGEGGYGDAPESFNRACRVNVVKVKKKSGDKIVVDFYGGEKEVSCILIPDIQIGDMVKVHFNYAIEKVENGKNSLSGE